LRFVSFITQVSQSALLDTSIDLEFATEEFRVTQAVKITITGSGDSGNDAPAADDFIGQVSDFLDVLKGVEKALDENGETQIIWRVTNAQMNSPLLVELTPYPRNPAVFIGDRAARVETATFFGIRAIEQGETKPKYFSDETSRRARNIHTRVANGLSKTTIKFGSGISKESLNINRVSALRVDAAFKAKAAVLPVPYRELGSVEGFLTKAELDGYGRAILRFRSRLTGDEIKAVASGPAFRQVGTMKLSDVWEGVRIRVYGTISYRDIGKIDGIQATGLEVLDQTKLPAIEDIIDENFTGGLSSEAFLAMVRND
jgi:hypothetical protein